MLRNAYIGHKYYISKPENLPLGLRISKATHGTKLKFYVENMRTCIPTGDIFGNPREIEMCCEKTNIFVDLNSLEENVYIYYHQWLSG